MHVVVVLILATIISTLFSDAFAQSGLADPAQMEADRARSARLSPTERERARALFDQAFSLYQTADFEAAKIGFERGLGIDPANGSANYYLGELLFRQKDYDGARDRFNRTIKFAPDSAEGLKAQTSLRKLEPWPLLAEQLKGAWCYFRSDGSKIGYVAFNFRNDGMPIGYTSGTSKSSWDAKVLTLLTSGNGFIVPEELETGPHYKISNEFKRSGQTLHHHRISCTSSCISFHLVWKRCE